MTCRCPGPSVVWGRRGRGPRKPARKAAEPRAGKAGRAHALRSPLSYFQDGGERRRPRHLGGSAHHLPATAPVVSPEHGGVEGNGLGEAQGRPREGPRGEKMLLPLSSTRWGAAWKGGCVLGQSPGLSVSQHFANRPPAWSLRLGDCSLPATAGPVAPLSALLGHPPKLRIWGHRKAGKVHSSPALPPSQPSQAPSSSSPCPPGVTALDGLQQPPCPRGFGKVGISLSGGQLSGWGGGEMEKGLVEEVTLGETGTSLGGEAALKSPSLSLSQELVL